MQVTDVSQSRLRIDGVNIDHLQSMTTEDGPFSWLTSGKVDAVLDIRFPRDSPDETTLNALIGEIADAITTAASSAVAERIPGQRELAKPPLSAPSDKTIVHTDSVDNPKVVIDIDLRFRDLKAAVPLFTSDLSYTSNALIRPIVAFMKSVTPQRCFVCAHNTFHSANRTLIPIYSRVAKDLSEFEGSWTMWESKLCFVSVLGNLFIQRKLPFSRPHGRHCSEGVRSDGVPRYAGEFQSPHPCCQRMEPSDDRERDCRCA